MRFLQLLDPYPVYSLFFFDRDAGWSKGGDHDHGMIRPYLQFVSEMIPDHPFFPLLKDSMNF